MVLNYKLGKGKKEIEDINEVLLSSKYYPAYAETVKKILLTKQLNKELPTNENNNKRIKIWKN